MHQLSNIKFSMWTDGRRQMCSIEAAIPDKLQNNGLRYISFYMTAEEFESVCNYGPVMISDVGHKLECFGDGVMFFDMERPTDTCGQGSFRYYNATFPVFIRKMLLRVARRVWKNGPQDETRTVLNIDPVRFVRWNKLYSCGSGRVELLQDDISRNYLEERLSENKTNLRENVDRLLLIAKNGTNRFWQTGKVRLSKDWDGFNFNILTPKGKSSLHGGVVDHGKNGKPAWSIHT